MVNEQARRNDDSGGLTSLFVSMIELGDAATKFTINQMQNAVDVFLNPGRAIDRTRDSMNNFSKAMYRSAGSAQEERTEESDSTRDLSGHEYRGHHNGGQRHAQAESTTETLTGRKL